MSRNDICPDCGDLMCFHSGTVCPLKTHSDAFEKLKKEIEKLKEENVKIKEFLEFKDKIISLMAHELILKGVNFDFSDIEERLAKLKEELR